MCAPVQTDISFRPPSCSRRYSSSFSSRMACCTSPPGTTSRSNPGASEKEWSGVTLSPMALVTGPPSAETVATPKPAVPKTS